MEETQEVIHKPYKINEGDIVTIIRNDVEKNGNNWTFYKVALKNKITDSQTYYKQLIFPSIANIPDGTRIRINKMAEYGRHLDKFRDTFYLYIEDYEIIEGTTRDALKEYQHESLMNNDYIF